MWFIHMIVGLYILTPAIRKIAEDRKISRYYLLIAIIFLFGYTTFKAVLQYTSFAGNEVLNKVDNNYSNMNLHFLMGYVPYFLLGYFLNTTDISRKGQTMVLIVGIVGFLWNILGNLYLSHRTNSLVRIFDDAFKMPVLMQCTGLFVVMKKCSVKIRQESKGAKIIASLSKYTFGAYMMHLLFREALDHFFSLNAETYSFILWTPVLALVNFALSMLLSAGANQIPGLKKYVV